MWRLSLPRTGISKVVHFAVDGSYLTTWSLVQRLPQTLCLLSTWMWYACIALSGNGTIVTVLDLVSMRAKLEPHELPTQSTSAFLSVPMRRGPWPHGSGLPM